MANPYDLTTSSLYKSLYGEDPTTDEMLTAPKIETPAPVDWTSLITNLSKSTQQPAWTTPGFNPDVPMNTPDDSEWKQLIPTTAPKVTPSVPTGQMSSQTSDWASQRADLMKKLQSQMGSYDSDMARSKQEVNKVGVQELADRIGALVGGTHSQADIGQQYTKERAARIAQIEKEFDRKTANLITQLDFGEKVTEAGRKDTKFGWDVAEEERKAAKELRDVTVFEEERDKKALERDPNSPQSQLARDLALKMNPQLKGRVESLSAEQINTMLPTLRGIYEIEERNEQKKLDRDVRVQAMQERLDDKKAQRAMQAEVRANNQYQKELVALQRKEQATEQNLQKMSKALQSPQALGSAIKQVEDQLGFKLTDYNPTSNTKLVNGKPVPVDVPGISIPGIGRTALFWDDKAAALNGSIAKVFNSTLSDRSGAAVTSNEMERLKNEFNDGKYNTEVQMLAALKKYRAAVTEELQNREAGFNTEVQDEYRSRGGMTSKEFGGTSSTSPTTRLTDSSTGRTTTVPTNLVDQYLKQYPNLRK